MNLTIIDCITLIFAASYFIVYHIFFKHQHPNSRNLSWDADINLLISDSFSDERYARQMTCENNDRLFNENEDVQMMMDAAAETWKYFPESMCKIINESHRYKPEQGISLSTTKQIYSSEDYCHFAGNIQREEHMDMSFHSCYNESRISVQNIITKWFTEDAIRCNADTNVRHTHPWIIFTGGALAVGKGHALGLLSKAMFPTLSHTQSIIANLDLIRPTLAEYTPNVNVNKYNQEIGLINELIIEKAIQMNHNVIIDGSLRDEWTVNHYVPMLKKRHPHYRFALIGVLPVSEEGLKANVEHRNRNNKRQTLIADSLDFYHNSNKVMQKMKCEMDVSVFVTLPEVLFPDMLLEVDIYTKWNNQWFNQSMTREQIKNHDQIKWDDLLDMYYQD